MESTKEAKEFIENSVARIQPLLKARNLAYWDATTTGNQKAYKEYERLQKEIEKIFNNKEEYELAKKFHNQEHQDPLIKRQITLLYHSYLGSQGDIKLIQEIVRKSAELEQKFNTYRAIIQGKEYSDNEIKEILKKETSSEKLQEVWEANKKQGEFVARELIYLIKLRNQLAKNLGFKNYYLLSLELNEQKEEEITKIYQQLDKATTPIFQQLKHEIDNVLSKKYKTKELKPWHYQDLFFQEAPEIYNLNLDNYYSQNILDIAKEFYKKLHLSVDDILARSDLYEKPKKYQHAYCIDIDRQGDVRILENIKNNEHWMETTLHELGHAVYSKFTDRKLPFLLIDSAHILTTEAIAQLFGRQSKNFSFMKDYCNLKDEKLAETLNKSLRLRQLIFSRWSQVMFNFEKSLYENPEQNLNLLWWELVKKFQLIDFSRDAPDWASKIHFVSSPVYYHNYLLGELFGSQLNNYISKNILHKEPTKNLPYNTQEIGEYIKSKVFMPGAKLEWNEMIKQATGEFLTPKYYIKEFC